VSTTILVQKQRLTASFYTDDVVGMAVDATVVQGKENMQSVWKKHADGGWKIAVDALIPDPAEAKK